MHEWHEQYTTTDRAVKTTALSRRNKSVIIETTWEGLNYNLSADDTRPPLIFESTVHGGPLHGHRAFYPTEDDAVRGHLKLVKMLSSGLPGPLLKARVHLVSTKYMVRETMTRPRLLKRHWIWLFFFSVNGLYGLANLTYAFLGGPTNPPRLAFTLFIGTMDVTMTIWAFQGFFWSRRRERENAAREAEREQFEQMMEPDE